MRILSLLKNFYIFVGYFQRSMGRRQIRMGNRNIESIAAAAASMLGQKTLQPGEKWVKMC